MNIKFYMCKHYFLDSHVTFLPFDVSGKFEVAPMTFSLDIIDYII